MGEEVKLAYGKSLQVKIGDLKELQGDLKDLSPESEEKLREQILKTGFAFAPHAWKDEKGKYWLIDGHQRVKVLKKLAEEGYKIPALQVIPVQAKNLTEARKRVLQGVSQYGHVTQQGLYDFVTDSKIDFTEIGKSFDMPGINFEQWSEAFFNQNEQPSPKGEATGSTEISESDVSSTLVHQCPKCGFNFSSPK